MTERDPLLADGDLPLELRLQQNVDRPHDARSTTDAAGTRRYEDVAYARLAGFRPLLLDLSIPASDAPVPLVVYLHGGAFLWGTHRGTLFGVGDALVDAGIAVATVQYRLGGESLFPAALHDAHAAIRWLRHFAGELGLDADRVGVMGESSGGQLAAFLGLDLDDPALSGRVGVVDGDTSVQAVVGWYAVTDATLFADPRFPATPPPGDQWPDGIVAPGAPVDALAIVRWASPAHHPLSNAAPALYIHGDSDTEVPSEHSRQLVGRLLAAGREAELMLVPGAGHVFAGADPTPVVARTVAFFADRLGASVMPTTAVGERS
ncbi:alpha/beta hydrolase [Glaciibacter flavus]|uniref:Alpha/beta hydrolase n=1 Tax=Orlajensenia flava TaxID=2565934 RepID=A0A4S4FTY9_9MICO|nr:alpha/beta hydrolase [Glaciibacter flavus]THG33811.1 alpha/beta hydrolase [Glaciibacter flavus]